MGSKNVVKVIKRRDLEHSIHDTSEPKEISRTEAQAERRSRRELVANVSNWVTERRERNHREEIEAVKRMFGDTMPFFGKV